MLFNFLLSKDPGIWVLGNEDSRVQKSIQWHATDIPNFADCGTLIVDMTTLNPSALHNLSLPKCQELFDGIFSRFNAGGEIICIFNESFDARNYEEHLINNYFWSPIIFVVEKVKPANSWQPIQHFGFKNYMERYLKTWDKTISFPQSRTKISWPGSTKGINVESTVISNSNQIIAGTFHAALEGSDGSIHMLPPLKDSKTAISAILYELGISTTTQKSNAPNWIETIDVPGLTKLDKALSVENTKIEKIIENVSKIKSDQNRLKKFKELLYEDGTQLEEIVKEALQILGISSVKKGRQNFEDLIFDCNSKSRDVCTIEVKGLESNMKIAHVRQALHWKLDYEEMGKKSKAVLIANIYRLEDISKSKSKRESFTDFKDFCNTHDVCILPTSVLFEFVKEKLEGQAINSRKIEKAIIDTKGVLLKV